MIEQVAPDPTELRELVKTLDYRPDWSIWLDDERDRGQASRGMTLIIQVSCIDSYEHDRQRGVVHYMPVPPASFDRRSWQHWLFEQCLLVERHEACEFFTIDGVKPYAPSHGPGNDPYLVRELGTVEDVETSFRGERSTTSKEARQ